MILSPLYRIAAFASFASALTTAFLIWGPEVNAPDFTSQLKLHENNLYLSQKWVLALHPVLAFVPMLGLCCVYLGRKVHLVLPGAIAGFSWMITELSQQAFVLVALNRYWRPGYLEAEKAEIKASYFTQLQSFMPVWDSFYFVIILGFGLASLLFGLAMITGENMEKVMGWGSVLIGSMSLISFISDYLHLTFLITLVNFWYDWIYSLLQPVWRLMLAGLFWTFYVKQKNIELADEQNH